MIDGFNFKLDLQVTSPEGTVRSPVSETGDQLPVETEPASPEEPVFAEPDPVSSNPDTFGSNPDIVGSNPDIVGSNPDLTEGRQFTNEAGTGSGVKGIKTFEFITEVNKKISYMYCCTGSSVVSVC